jgi:hypothetical protein
MEGTGHYQAYQRYKAWAADALDHLEDVNVTIQNGAATFWVTKAAVFASLAAAEAALSPDYHKS